MKTTIRITFAVLILSHAHEVASQGELEPGAYQVQMQLELPHLEDMNVSKTSTICITDAPTHGLVVLSDNNPLARCPASNVRKEVHTLTFDVVCEGQNQGIAWAKFTLHRDQFQGAFDMKMGGKNMTMTERQRGRRIGACTEAPRS